MFDCLPYEGGRLLRADPVLSCDDDTWTAFAVVSAAAITIYCLGIPWLAWLVVRRMRTDRRVDILVRSYQAECWWMESVDLLRKFVLTGPILVAWSDSKIQLWLGGIVSVAAVCLHIRLMPYKEASCGQLQLACLLQLVLIYLSTHLFYDEGSTTSGASALGIDPFAADLVLVGANCAVFGVLFFSIVRAASATTVLQAKRGVRRRELREALATLKDLDRRRTLLAALEKAEHGGLGAAKSIFESVGLPPQSWGISKKQLRRFGDDVRAAIREGKIKGQPDPDRPNYYPQAKFDDPRIGPNMHQVNAGFIKPLTMDGTNEQPAFMPGLSYALTHNYERGGLLCKLFISHVRHHHRLPQRSHASP